MLTENTVSKLHEMKLSVMAQSFREQMTNHEFVELSFEDRFSLLVFRRLLFLEAHSESTA